MCNQRDRLIGYVYDECEASERDEVQRHLETCGECRTEIAGLRSVREDLLAWDVPDHESVWRPFAPAPAPQWWRQVPGWAMAAAASLVLMSGAAGGAVAHGFLPDGAQANAARPESQPVQTSDPVMVSLTPADLSAAEQRWLTEVRKELDEMDARLQKVSTRPMPAGGGLDALLQELQDLRAHNQELTGVVRSNVASHEQDRKALDIKDAWLETKLKNLEALVQLQVR
jgi:Putative zinc-finger